MADLPEQVAVSPSLTTGDTSYKGRARALLAGQWNNCAVVSLVYLLVSVASSSIPRLGSITSLVISGPMAVGLAMFFLHLVRKEPHETGDIFKGFQDFLRAFLTYLLMAIFVVLWALLLIVPGIIAALSYSLAFYILVDNPGMPAIDAIRKSKELMSGRKGDLLMLGLSFLGWGLLCVLTLGIGFLWLLPYMSTSFALFYEDAVKAKA